MKKYAFPGRVRFSEVDEFGSLTLYHLLNYLQDCATFHGEDSGVGLAHNKAQGVAWVIADMQLKITRYPRFNENIVVNTWADRFRGMIGHRCFSIEDEEGAEIVLGNSNWVFMNMEKQEPVRIPQEQIDGYGVWPELRIQEDLGKRKVKMPEEVRFFDDIIIREEHLDTNHHVNNAQYVRMAKKYLPADFEVHRLRAEWQKQALLGEAMHPAAAEQDGRYYVQFRDEAGGSYFTCCFGR